jgi:ABC-type amino acid transport system permease subunit
VLAIFGALLLGIGMSLCMVFGKMILGVVIGLVGIVAVLMLIPLTKGLK